MPLQKPGTPGLVMLVTTLSTFMVTFAGSSVNVSLPHIGETLGLGGLGLSWVTTAYVLGSAVFLLPMGRFGDIFGRKRIFTIGIILYALGSFLAWISPTGNFLTGMRALTGLGASLNSATAAAILIACYPAKERGRVLGINVAAAYLGLSTGPFLGGFITALLGWRTLFLFHGMGAALVALLVIIALKGEWFAAKGEKIDWPGTLLYSLGLGAVLLGFTGLPGVGSVALLLGGIGVLVLFVVWELKCPHPLFQIRVFRGNRVFALSNVAAMISYSATFSVSFFLSLYLEQIRGLPPQGAGLILVAQPAVQTLFSPLTGKLSDKIQPRILASLGMLVTALGLGILAFMEEQTPIALILGALILLGLGFALFSSPNTNAVMGSVEHKHIGIASASIGTMRMVGQALSMGIAMVLISAYLGHEVVSHSQSAPFLSAFRWAFGFAALLSFLGLFASLARGRSVQIQ